MKMKRSWVVGSTQRLMPSQKLGMLTSLPDRKSVRVVGVAACDPQGSQTTWFAGGLVVVVVGVVGRHAVTDRVGRLVGLESVWMGEVSTHALRVESVAAGLYRWAVWGHLRG